MNPQPEYIEVLTFTFGFILLVLYFYADPKNHYKFSDKFTIAEIEQPASPQVNCTATVSPSKSKKPKQQKQSKPVNHNSKGYTQLQQDCFDALASLGIKTKRERTFIVNETFNRHDPKTIQEFLKLALNRV